MSSIQRSMSRERRFPLGLLIVVFAISDFIIPPVIDSLESSVGEVGLVGMLAGVIAGQLGLLIIWAVLGPGKAGVRQALTMLLAVFLWFSCFAGFVVADPPSSVVHEMGASFLFLPLVFLIAQLPLWGGMKLTTGGRIVHVAMLLAVFLWFSCFAGIVVADPHSSVVREMGTYFLFLPLVFLIAQLPLWGMKLTTGGRIVHVDKMAGQSPTEGRQFGLRHLMGAMVLVAVALSLANSGLRVLEIDDVGGWVPLLVGGLACGLWSPFVTRPCIWAALSAKKRGPAVVAVGIYTVLMTMLVLGVLEIISRGSIEEEQVVLFFAFHGSLMAVILGTLHVARLCGYTFIRRGRRRPDLESDSSFAVQGNSSGDAGAQ